MELCYNSIIHIFNEYNAVLMKTSSIWAKIFDFLQQQFGGMHFTALHCSGWDGIQLDKTSHKSEHCPSGHKYTNYFHNFYFITLIKWITRSYCADYSTIWSWKKWVKLLSLTVSNCQIEIMTRSSNIFSPRFAIYFRFSPLCTIYFTPKHC